MEATRLIQPPRAASGPLMLADIGGYTQFLQDVATRHADDPFAGGVIPPAYEMVSSLLDGIITRLVPPFTLSKIEGDAVFVYSMDTASVPHGQALRDTVEACYGEFRTRLDRAHEVWTCRCGACERIHGLELKFVVHTGPFFIHQVAGSTELAGPDVVLAHRLLKSEAAEVVGSPAYALVTRSAAQTLDVPPDDARALTARFDHYAPVEALVYRVGAREAA